jgi:uncharacterized protein
MYNRTITHQMDKWMDTHHSFTIYGARQVGKTTLVIDYAKKSGLKYMYLDCDQFEVRKSLEVEDSVKLAKLIGDSKLVIIDEAQRVHNIGLNMKIIHDNIPGVKVIATGSSAFDLASEIKEPMTGRDFDFYLYPLSISELLQKSTSLDLISSLENLMVYGGYPSVISLNSNEAKERQLMALTDSYLYKDLLELDLIKKTSALKDLLRVLAFSVGSEVTNQSLAEQLGIKGDTVDKYIDLLEQCFIIKRIRPFNRKVTSEIKHPYKVYFWDLGIRNGLMSEFKSISLRDDRSIGGLWENFVIIERIKKMANEGIRAQHYFWRTTDTPSKEYDLVEVVNGDISVFEVKWGKAGVNKVKKYSIFFDTYPGSQLHVISKENFLDYLS